MGTIFVPIFIVTGVLFCICGCCLPCMYCITSQGGLDLDEFADSVGNTQPQRLAILPPASGPGSVPNYSVSD